MTPETIVIISGLSGLAVLESGGGSVQSVVCTRPELMPLLRRRTEPCVLMAADEVAGWVGDQSPERVMLLFPDDIPDELPKTSPVVIAVGAVCDSFHVDALPAAILSAASSIRIRLCWYADGMVAYAARRVVPIDDGQNLAEAGAAIATAMRRWLEDPADEPAADKSWRPAPQFALPTRIDWARPTQQVLALIRAVSRPGPRAKTWWRGNRVTVDQARLAGDRPQGLPPGTVLDAGKEILVCGSDGLLALGGLHDLIGPVDPGRVRPGDRLGGDSADMLADLAARVADLEHVVRCLARDADFLAPGQ